MCMIEEFAKRVSGKRVRVDATHTLNVSSSLYSRVEKDLLREIKWPEGPRKFSKGERVIVQRQNKYHRSNRGQIVGQVIAYSGGVLSFSVQSVSALSHTR